MKKAIKLVLLLLFFQATSIAQISIDSLHVYLGAMAPGGNRLVDSIFVRGSSTGPTFKSVFVSPPFNDACGTILIRINFDNCDTTPSVFTKTIPIGPSFDSERIIVYAIWDTLMGCSTPAFPIITDTAFWEPCYSTSIVETTLHDNLKISPNPSNAYIQITFEKSVSIEAIELYNINGKLVRQFNSNERTFDVQQFDSGIYFLKVESKEGVVTKKIVIQH